MIVCKSYDEVHSAELMNFCLHPKNPVTIIRGKIQPLENFKFKRELIPTQNYNLFLVIKIFLRPKKQGFSDTLLKL